MKKSTKWAALLMAGTMALGSLAGCGGSGGSSTGGASAGSAAETSKTSGTEAPAQGELTTLKIMGVDHAANVGEKTVYLSDWVNGDSKIWQKLADDLAAKGVALELDLIKDDQYPTVLQTQIAAGLDCDLVNITPLDTETRYTMANQKKILPLNEYWESYSEGQAKEFFTTGNGAKEAKMLALEDGNVYWLTDVGLGCYGDLQTGGVLGFMIRKDWLDKLGKSMPATTDELYDTLVAFQNEDVNGTGEKDEVLALDLKNFGTGIAQWFGLGPDITYIDKKDNTIQSPWYHKNVKAYIEYLQKLYQAGLLDTSDQGTQKKVENKISGLFSWSLETWEEPQIIYPEGDDKPYYVAFLANAVEGEEPYLPLQEAYQLGWTATAVTSQCDKPEAVGKLFDYLTSEEYWMLTEFGIEGYNYKDAGDGLFEKIKGDSFEQETKFMTNSLWANGGIFPRYEMRADRRIEIAEVEKAGYGEKVDYSVKGFTYEYTIPHETQANLAVKTEDQMKKLAEIETDLKTYSEELLLKLVLGQKSLDDWDTYMSDLKRLGLDDKIAIEQDCYDRAQ